MAVKPSPCGMRTSSNTSSGLRSLMKRRASMPVPASATSVICGSRSSSERSWRRASGSSSAMTVRIGSDIDRFLAWDAQAHRGVAASHEQFEREALIAVKVNQSAARHIEPDAEARHPRLAAFAETAHADREIQPFRRRIRLDRDGAAAAGFHAVTNGIFDEWLQDQRRHEQFLGVRLDVALHGQAILEAQLLDRAVALGEIQLLAERDAGLTARLEHDAQQVAQGHHRAERALVL